ncbi:ABC transporter ATP-binding protein, partial [Halobellus captivus]|uniref:ABC transporter ATP-binding protein n=1 Tax=Halobellus captivus TaxID=2592614 RepID=UPI00193A5DE2
TALDVIMQDQIFKYLDRIKAETDVSMILITHDISVIFESCDSMAIMHSGQIAETGSCVDIFDSPHHPYSILLQQAFPDVDHPDRELQTIDGYPPELTGDTDFCTFIDRCPWAQSECRQGAPPLEAVSGADGEKEHLAACVRMEAVQDSTQRENIAMEVED